MYIFWASDYLCCGIIVMALAALYRPDSTSAVARVACFCFFGEISATEGKQKQQKCEIMTDCLSHGWLPVICNPFPGPVPLPEPGPPGANQANGNNCVASTRMLSVKLVKQFCLPNNASPRWQFFDLWHWLCHRHCHWHSVRPDVNWPARIINMLINILLNQQRSWRSH